MLFDFARFEINPHLLENCVGSNFCHKNEKFLACFCFEWIEKVSFSLFDQPPNSVSLSKGIDFDKHLKKS